MRRWWWGEEEKEKRRKGVNQDLNLRHRRGLRDQDSHKFVGTGGTVTTMAMMKKKKTFLCPPCESECYLCSLETPVDTHTCSIQLWEQKEQGKSTSPQLGTQMLQRLRVEGVATLWIITGCVSSTADGGTSPKNNIQSGLLFVFPRLLFFLTLGAMFRIELV